MTSAQLARLAMVLGALLLLWGAASLASRGARGPSGSDRFAIPTAPADSVDSVIVTRPADTTRLTRRDSATWMVNGHPASRLAVQELFSALADTSRRTELVAARPGSHAGLGVDSAKGATIRIVRGGSTLAKLVQGNRGPGLDGGYFRAAEDSAVYLVGGSLAQVLEREPDEWRDRHIAGTAADSVARIEIARGKRSYAVRRDGTSWVLAPGGRADSAAVGALLGGYRRVEAAGFATKPQAEGANFTRPDRRAALLRADGTPLLSLAFDSTVNGFWVRSGTDSTVYRIDTWLADQLTPTDSALKATGS
ncbi:MAG: DUF4340 domain-containing protein [Gemmatimonadales bacterium]|nr:DUF4340 domain-containing protein [Gemmatimonadales bacterium]